MKLKIFCILCVLTIVILGCSKGDNPTSLQEISDSLNQKGIAESSGYSNLKILGVVEAQFNPTTRQGECYISDSRNLQYLVEDLEEIEDIDIDARFVELDHEFYFMHGEPIHDTIPQAVGPHKSDGVFINLTITNNGSTTIYHPMAVLYSPAFHIWNGYVEPGDFDYTNYYFSNADGFIGCPLDMLGSLCWDEELVTFRSCYYPYIDLALYNQNDPEAGTDHILQYGDTDDTTMMLVVPEDHYEPVYWTIYVLGYDIPISDQTAVPLSIDTPFENNLMPLEVTDDWNVTFRVRVDIPDTFTLEGDETMDDWLEVVIDLDALGVEPEERFQWFEPDPLDNELWEVEVDLTDLAITDLHNPFLLPVMCRQLDGTGELVDGEDLDYPNHADLYMFAWQNPASRFNGYHMISYLAQDPISGEDDLFLHNTYTDERWNISHANGTQHEIFHTISKDGTRVTWSANDGLNTFIYLATYPRGVEEWDDDIPDLVVSTEGETEQIIWDNSDNYMGFGLPDYEDINVIGFEAPVISGDGNRVVFHVIWDDENNDRHLSVIVANVSDPNPANWRFLWVGIWEQLYSGYPTQTWHDFFDPWISDTFAYNSYIGGLHPDTAYMLCFPSIAKHELAVNYGLYSIFICYLTMFDGRMVIDTAPVPGFGRTKEIRYSINGENQSLGQPSWFYCHPGYVRYFSRVHVVMRENDNAANPNYGYITYEAETQGGYQAFITRLTPHMFNNDVLVLGFPGIMEPEYWCEKLGNYESGSKPNNFLPLTAMQSEEADWNADGRITAVRDGLGVKSRIWLNMDNIESPISTSDHVNVPLNDWFNLDAAMADVPAVSQDEFQFTGAETELVYPAFAFDSHVMSPGDICYCRMIGFQNDEVGRPKFVVKRLTYDGTARFPRLSGMIRTNHFITESTTTIDNQSN